MARDISMRFLLPVTQPTRQGDLFPMARLALTGL